MDIARALTSLGIALGLGLLVGLQRERANSALAGIRTFPLITILGTLCAMIGDTTGGWIVGLGLLAVAAATGVGNFFRERTDQSPGITTEIAALVMFAVGALTWIGDWRIAAAVGVVCAVLLQLKQRMHALADKIEERDLAAVLQFCAVAFIVLPVLPDRSFDPLGVLNPRHIWWMVVLVVGISLVGYVVLKLARGHLGIVLGGLIGGLVSSTATAASYSRRAAGQPDFALPALLAITLSSCVVYLRVLVEIGVVAWSQLPALAPPMLIMLFTGIVASIIVWFRVRHAVADLPDAANPSELKSALYFGLIYAVVLLAVALGHKYLGDRGVYVVAALSGLTDMDAITLSSSRLAHAGTIASDTALRTIVIAIIANLAFKTALAGILGGRRLFLWVAMVLGCSAACGVAILLFWPEGLAIPMPDLRPSSTRP
ncbi:MAG: MgtC/SapB family protein [Phycisphaerales bacterium]|nr:MgtC/SapB family protein [Phycisphaerales bacterium]